MRKLLLQHSEMLLSTPKNEHSYIYHDNTLIYRGLSQFLRLNKTVVGSEATVLRQLESNTDAMQSIRHEVLLA